MARVNHLSLNGNIYDLGPDLTEINNRLVALSKEIDAINKRLFWKKIYSNDNPTLTEPIVEGNLYAVEIQYGLSSGNPICNSTILGYSGQKIGILNCSVNVDETDWYSNYAYVELKVGSRNLEIKTSNNAFGGNLNIVSVYRVGGI